MKTFSVVLLLLFSAFSYAGPLPPEDLSGQILKTWLKDNWYAGKHSSLGYNKARRAMYDDIDKDSNGKVTGVYSGFVMQGRDTTFLDPINAEHTVPQSWFNKRNPMRSDIHHLFPTHKDVNNARSNFPFDEIDDNLTDKWYAKDGSELRILTEIPSRNIDSYSELDKNNAFEPREEHKGNLARAVYYFYTMYPSKAGNISRIADRDVLFQWHINDPVDSAEIERNNRVAAQQGNRNPYIVHPDLVARAWGHDVPIVDPDVPDVSVQINAMRVDIATLEASLERLKSSLMKLESLVGDN